MSSWYSSWFSNLPKFDFAVPSSIQRRFFSFLLRRTLGHLLKPGQLDLHQIDSQLGSGIVHVKDLELDEQAINQSLVGLPVILYDGFISGVTARIPFPNPLSSTVGCHVQSLSLTFHITPEQPKSPLTSFHNSSNLADSVVSVAETFIHDELTPREEATLRQTLRPSTSSLFMEDASENLPGGFNPFAYNLYAEEVRKEPHGGDDPAGVSVFATLIERLLAKFEFSATDTRITIVYPGRASFTFSVSEIAYRTDSSSRSQATSGLQSVSEGNHEYGQIRIVSISGLTVTSRDLRVVAPSPTITSTLSPVSFTTSRRSSPTHYKPPLDQLSCSSSSSSLDEDTQLMMSQSIAMLLPSSSCPSSASSSLYQSAISTEHTQPTEVDINPALQLTNNVVQARPGPRLSIPCRDSAEEVLLSFGSQPIVFSLQTPSRLVPPSGHVPQAGGDHPPGSEDLVREKFEKESLHLSVNVGTFACAFRSRHLRVLLDIMDACTSQLPTSSPVSRKETSPEFLRSAVCLEVNVVVRAVVIIALPELVTGELLSLDTFYERPLVPPRLPRTYLRLLLDALSTSFRLSPPSHDQSASGAPRTTPSKLVDRSTSAKMIISDVSLFAFHGLSSTDDPHVAAPILLTDHHLPTLYATRCYRPSLISESPQDIKLPVLEVVDWTQTKFKNGSAKLSTWRSRNRAISGKTDKSRTPSQRPSDLPSSPSPFISSPSSEVEERLPVPPAIETSGQMSSPSPSGQISWTVAVKMTPFHLFFDLGMIFRENLLMQFVDDIASATIFTPKKGTGTVDSQVLCQQSLRQFDDVDDIEVQKMSPDKRVGEERRRLETLVLEDLNLGMNCERTKASRPRSSRQRRASPERRKEVLSEPGHSFCLTCPMIRVEVRCPPPPLRVPRSGCMLFDLHDLMISNDAPSAKSSLRFSEEARSSLLHSSENISHVILNVRVQEIVAAYSSVDDNVAHAILALSFLPAKEIGPETSTLLATDTVPDTLPPSVVLGRPDITKNMKGSCSRKLSMTVEIPLVNLVMDKVIFDGLQFWADDVAQLVERSFAGRDVTTVTLPSRNPSLIGSRYFTQIRRSGTHSIDESVMEEDDRQITGETMVKVGITEALLRFVIPRNGESHHPRPFDISTMDVGVLLRLKPEEKEASVVVVEIMDLRVADTCSAGDCVVLLRNPTCSLLSTPEPLVGCRITSFAVPDTTAKESRVKVSLVGFTVHPPLDSSLGNDLAMFAKAPPGVFESVIPSECTRLTIGVLDVSVHLHTLEYPGAAVLHLDEAEFSTDLAGDSSGPAFKLSVSSAHVFLVDSMRDASESTGPTQSYPGRGVDFWKNSGYALIAELSHTQLNFRADNTILPPDISIFLERIGLRIHLCADTIGALTGLISHMTRASDDVTVCVTPEIPSTNIGHHERNMIASLDEHAFRLVPEVGSAADMICDDLPANLDYLDASFGTAAGLRELRDDDLDDFDVGEWPGHSASLMGQLGTVSNVGGETVRILKPLSFNEHHFDTISPDAARDPDNDTTLRVRVRDSDIVLFLHDGFDWPRTRKIIEKEVKEMRKRLARIRQLVSTGQMQEPIDEMTSATLFNSYHIGLERDLESMDPDALIAAINDELDDPAEVGTESSWQSLHHASPGRPRTVSTRVHGKRLTRSKGPSIEIRLDGLNAEIDNYRPGQTLVSRTLILVRDLEILDHIKTSTWKKFLTDMRSDSRGNVRETDSNMARVELLSVRPSPSHPIEEARLRAKLLPLRLYVDQDAIDFFKKFFAFQDPDNPSVPEDGKKKEEIYFQHAEVFPVDIKLDYKPRRVDYRALRDGRTIELMNFFHFDGAEMTLRHLTLHGITGWPRFFDTLNDLWTPDVKATQLVDVISGVAPIRSVVNVGSGVADLVLLPIAQYKKDGRIVRGLQKGTKAFVQSTAMEAIKLGARLATGTQVILEQAEDVLGGQFKDSITAEALQIPYESEHAEGSEEDLISRYAAQPTGLKEGVQSAYRSLQRNLQSAAQTILAVPMEVYERSGNEGAVRAVVRAVPIAVLKPMIGASEAVSKTLMGLHNTLDPNIRLDNEAKYKHR